MKRNLLFLLLLLGLAAQSQTISIGGNQYAFQYSGNTNYGMYFNLSQTRYELRDGSGANLFSVHANTGAVTANGTLSFGPNGDLLIGANRYAFRYSANTNYGFFFNSTQSRYEFRTANASSVFWVNANNGMGWFGNGVRVGNSSGTEAGLIRFNGTNFQGYDGSNWVNLSGSGSSSWTVSGNDQYSSVSGNVGIGTSSPLARLHLNGSESDTVGTGFNDAPSTTARIHNHDLTNNNYSSLDFTTRDWNSADFVSARVSAVCVDHDPIRRNGQLAFYTYGNGILSEKMRITNQGYVGIGMTNPDAMLDIDGQIKIRGGNPGTDKVLVSDADGLASWQSLVKIPTGIKGQTLYHNGSAWESTSFMRMNTNFTQRIEIGNNLDSMYLKGTDLRVKEAIHTHGRITISNDWQPGSSKLHVEGDTTYGGFNLRQDPIVGVGNAPNYNGVAVRGTFNVTPGYGYGGYFTGGSHGVAGRSENAGPHISYGVYGVATGGGNGTRYGGHFQVFNAPTSQNYAVYGATNVGYAGYFAGDVHVTGTFTNPSDANLKKNEKPVTGILEKLNQLQVKTYDFKNEEYSFLNLPKGKQYGFIAQEMEQVFPELVVQNYHPASDPNTEGPQHEALEYKSVNYIGFIPVLAEAVKEVREESISEIEALRKQVENQNEKIEWLQQQIALLLAANNSGNNLNKTNNAGSANLTKPEKAQAVLSQNVPNPFNGTTVIGYNLPETTRSAQIVIHDLKGRIIKQYQLQGFGNGSVEFNSQNLPAGVYIYSLIADGQKMDAKRMVLNY